nr:hypothetical protein [uncultured Cohaesibacter sp.]
MSRRLQSMIAAILLLFGLFAGAGQSFALGHSEPVSCAEATVTLGTVVAEVPGCDQGMFHQTCTSDGVCSYLILKSATNALEARLHTLPYPATVANLTGSRTPPDTPPPIFLS